jgi:hypothetical protein
MPTPSSALAVCTAPAASAQAVPLSSDVLSAWELSEWEWEPSACVGERLGCEGERSACVGEFAADHTKRKVSRLRSPLRSSSTSLRLLSTRKGTHDVASRHHSSCDHRTCEHNFSPKRCPGLAWAGRPRRRLPRCRCARSGRARSRGQGSGAPRSVARSSCRCRSGRSSRLLRCIRRRKLRSRVAMRPLWRRLRLGASVLKGCVLIRRAAAVKCA